MSMNISRRFKLWAKQLFPMLSKLGKGRNRFTCSPTNDSDQSIAKICRGQESKIVLTGSHSYGIYGIEVKSW